jgi:hypothetical protein
VAQHEAERVVDRFDGGKHGGRHLLRLLLGFQPRGGDRVGGPDEAVRLSDCGQAIEAVAGVFD